MSEKVNQYKDIFQSRGIDHAEAFRRYPESVKEEVEAILRLGDIQPQEVVLDMPSASGFLSRYLKVPGVRLIAVDPSPVMHALCQKVVAESYCHPLHKLPLHDESVDVVICLAGLHHEPKLPDVFDEVSRVLGKKGRFAIAEIDEGSDVAEFFNRFVDHFSSMGHQGNFFNDDYLKKLKKSNFLITKNEIVNYHWKFSSESSMADCLSLMFGIDKANPSQVIDGVTKILGVDILEDGQIGMRWGLRHTLCTKS